MCILAYVKPLFYILSLQLRFDMPCLVYVLYIVYTILSEKSN